MCCMQRINLLHQTLSRRGDASGASKGAAHQLNIKGMWLPVQPHEAPL